MRLPLSQEQLILTEENIVSLKQICLFTRSYIGDIELVPYLYKSVAKHVGDIGEVVLIIEKQDLSAFRKVVPSWVRLVVEETFAVGTIQHKYSKLVADTHTSKEFVFHIDSDSIFVRRPQNKELFLGKKPYLELISYRDLLTYQNSTAHINMLKESILNKNILKNELRKELVLLGIGDTNEWLDLNYETWLNDHFEEWFINWFYLWKRSWGLDVWREGTEYAMGDKVDYEFNVRPEKLYPRSAYSICRGLIERNHGMSLEEFIKSRIGMQAMNTPRDRYFSDYNFIGAVLHKYMHSSMEWIHVISKRDEDLYAVRPKFIQQFISYDMLENGKLKASARELLERN